MGTSIAVIGLYIAFVLPIFLRYRAKDKFERGAWHLGNHYKWIDPLAILWIVLICVLFLLPLFPDGIPGNGRPERPLPREVNWIDVNYAPLTVGGAFILFGGWWIAVREELVQGPGADGLRGGARGRSRPAWPRATERPSLGSGA